MVINTRYNIGDKVWHNTFGKPERGVILSISAYTTLKGDSVFYRLADRMDGNLVGVSVEENDLYLTKRELEQAS